MYVQNLNLYSKPGKNARSMLRTKCLRLRIISEVADALS